MATLKLEKMTTAQRQELATQLAAYEKKDAKLTRLVGAFKTDLDDAGFTAAQAASLLLPARARGFAKKSAPVADKTGAKPAPGVTYKHPATGETWTPSLREERVRRRRNSSHWSRLVAPGLS